MAKAPRQILKSGTTVSDYMSQRALLRAFGSESAVRTELSRLRSIVAKRTERMAAAGETENAFYQKFGGLRQKLPTVSGLSMREMAAWMKTFAHSMAGSKAASSLEEVRTRRKEGTERLIKQAEKAGDTTLVEDLKKNPSASQWKQIRKVMDMIYKVGGRDVNSGTVFTLTMKTVLEPDLDEESEKKGKKKKKRNLLSLAAEVMQRMETAKVENLEELQKRFTAQGTTRVSWEKAHKKRGG